MSTYEIPINVNIVNLKSLLAVSLDWRVHIENCLLLDSDIAAVASKHQFDANIFQMCIELSACKDQDYAKRQIHRAWLHKRLREYADAFAEPGVSDLDVVSALRANNVVGNDVFPDVFDANLFGKWRLLSVMAALLDQGAEAYQVRHCISTLNNGQFDHSKVEETELHHLVEQYYWFMTMSHQEFERFSALFPHDEEALEWPFTPTSKSSFHVRQFRFLNRLLRRGVSPSALHASVQAAIENKEHPKQEDDSVLRDNQIQEFHDIVKDIDHVDYRHLPTLNTLLTCQDMREQRDNLVRLLSENGCARVKQLLKGMHLIDDFDCLSRWFDDTVEQLGDDDAVVAFLIAFNEVYLPSSLLEFYHNLVQHVDSLSIDFDGNAATARVKRTNFVTQMSKDAVTVQTFQGPTIHFQS